MLRLLYILIALWLSIYGLQALVLTILYARNRKQKVASTPVDEDDWPRVAVQLPIYNERHVVERLIDSAAELDYPHDRLEVQVLDDSTDDTTALAEARAAYYRQRGINVQVLHRSARAGFKAGALAWGLAQTDAPFLAIFDADFRPRPDFLRKTLPSLLADAGAGMVQTRWAHLNDVYSPLTRAQSLILDGHFAVEQVARNRSGLLSTFNGSGGIWRRTCVEQAGGWQADTMTEDMDLSYRAQLAGWHCLYLPDVEAPAELPPQIVAFKQQQARWAQGSVQCLRKLGRPILFSHLNGAQKLMALVHISNYAAAPLAIALLLVSLPLLWQPQQTPPLLFALVGLSSLGPPLLFAVAQSALHRDWPRRMCYLPVLIAMGIGITWSTTRAMWQGLLHWGGTFSRTPKFRLEGRQGNWSASVYRLLPDRSLFGEVALTLYAFLAIAVACFRGSFGAVPYLGLYALSFALVAGIGLYQHVGR